MDRRSFIKKSAGLTAGAAAASTLAAPAIAQSMPKVSWRLASSFPKSLDTIYGGALTVAKFCKESTDGNFEVQAFAAGEIVPALENAKAAAAGTIEVAIRRPTISGASTRLTPSAPAFPFGLNARQHNAWYYYGGGNDLMNEFYATQGLYGISRGNTGAQMGGWFRKEIKTVADLSGLKMRIGGFAGKIISKLGVVPQSIPGGEIYQALEKGTIDATEWVGPYDDEKLGFNKVAPNYYYPGWWEGGSVLHCLVNKAKWDELPAAYKSVFDAACRAANADMLASYDAKNPAALRRLAAGGAKLAPFSHGNHGRLLPGGRWRSMPNLSASNAGFKKIYDQQLAFKKDAYLWAQFSEYRLRHLHDDAAARQQAVADCGSLCKHETPGEPCSGGFALRSNATDMGIQLPIFGGSERLICGGGAICGAPASPPPIGGGAICGAPASLPPIGGRPKLPPPGGRPSPPPGACNSIP